MQLTQNTTYSTAYAKTPQRSARIMQSDRFEIMIAATEAENSCPLWVADALSQNERVPS